jgi:hypothetical protein
MPRIWRALSIASLLITAMRVPSLAAAQTPPPGPPPPPPPQVVRDIDGRVKVFIDCSGFWDCDSEYFRTNLTYVDHVRDRTVADVHILITGQSTGSGGNEVTLAFIGLGPFVRNDDTLRYTSAANSTSDVVRSGLVKKIKLGLTRYVAHSSTADLVTIGASAPSASAAAKAPQRDPWNYWVMRVRFNGSMYGESSSKSKSFSGGASASRTTEAWKTSLSASASYRDSSYDLGDGDWYKTITRDAGLNGLAVKSLGGRWAAGGRASVQSSTYSNERRVINVAPALEFNFFPYAESTRRILTLQYAVGVTAYSYREVTLYDKLSETLPNHSLTLNLEARQPWGQVSLQVDGSQYLSKLDKYRLACGGGIDLRLGKGLSLNLNTWLSYIRDQLSLPKGEASIEEILVRQRQMATSYRYSVYFGISYTFGSIYNNVVNPRFGGGGGGGMVVMY